MLRLMGSPKGIISAQLQATESKGSCGSKRPFGIEPVIGAPVGEDLTRGPQQDGCGVPAETDELAEHREPGPGEDALLAEEGGRALQQRIEGDYERAFLTSTGSGGAFLRWRMRWDLSEMIHSSRPTFSNSMV